MEIRRRVKKITKKRMREGKGRMRVKENKEDAIKGKRKERDGRTVWRG